MVLRLINSEGLPHRPPNTINIYRRPLRNNIPCQVNLFKGISCSSLKPVLSLDYLHVDHMSKMELNNWLQGTYGSTRPLTWESQQLGNPPNYSGWEVVALCLSLLYPFFLRGNANSEIQQSMTWKLAEELDSRAAMQQRQLHIWPLCHSGRIVPSIAVLQVHMNTRCPDCHAHHRCVLIRFRKGISC
jgi:hypothetical protein